jgi:hypothetical protein
MTESKRLPKWIVHETRDGWLVIEDGCRVAAQCLTRDDAEDFITEALISTSLYLGGGYMLAADPDRAGVRLLYMGVEIARPFCIGYARRVIRQHRPPGRATEETT